MKYASFYQDFMEMLQSIDSFEEHLYKICFHMKTISPKRNEWFFDRYFLKVKVQKEDYSLYEAFLNDLVGEAYSCIYEYENNVECKLYFIPIFSLEEIILSEGNYILRRGHYGLL